MMKQQRVVNAYNTTLSAMRQARDNAVSQRTSYTGDFRHETRQQEHDHSSAEVTTFQGAQSSVTYQLPTDVSFRAKSAIARRQPRTVTEPGLVAIDFGYTAQRRHRRSTTIYFCPDGSAQDDEGHRKLRGQLGWRSGVHRAGGRSAELASDNAVGRDGPHSGMADLRNNGGGYQWLRQ